MHYQQSDFECCTLHLLDTSDASDGRYNEDRIRKIRHPHLLKTQRKPSLLAATGSRDRSC